MTSVERRMRPRAEQELRGLGLDTGAERSVGDRVVHVGEHEVVPDQQPEFVAQREEVVAEVVVCLHVLEMWLQVTACFG